MEEIVKKTLMKADLVKEDEKGFTVSYSTDGLVVKIWYRTIGDDNVLVRHEVITLEQWEWERHGCTNAQEWRRYLNRTMWADYRAGLKKVY